MSWWSVQSSSCELKETSGGADSVTRCREESPQRSDSHPASTGTHSPQRAQTESERFIENQLRLKTFIGQNIINASIHLQFKAHTYSERFMERQGSIL